MSQQSVGDRELQLRTGASSQEGAAPSWNVTIEIFALFDVTHVLLPKLERNVERKGASWDLSCQNPKPFVSILSEVAGWSPEQRADRRQMFLAFAERYLNDNGAVEASRDMFRAVIRSTGEGSH